MEIKSLIRNSVVPPLAVVDSILRRAANRRGLPPYKIRAKTHHPLFVLGGSGWLRLGEQMLQEAVEFAGLTPESEVVEIGCACGIVAIPMKNYLTTGSYIGLDVIPECIQWCQANLSDNRFHFFDLDVYHALYNKKGTKNSNEIIFPIKDNSIDSVFSISVFTHFFPEEISHYLTEISRILKPGGICMATMFTKDNYVPGQSQIRFDYADNSDCLYFSEKHPTWAVALSRSMIEDIAEKARMPVERMAAGHWDGKSQEAFLHDMYVFKHKA